MGEAAGLRDPASYYPEYTDEKVAKLKELAAQPKANPEIEKAQIDAQAKDAQAQRDHEYRMAQAQAKAALDQQAAAHANEQKVTQINGELALKREQLDAELRLKRELGYAELGVDHDLGMAGVAAKTSVQTASTGVHVGGEPG
jgi:hypothetical protein